MRFWIQTGAPTAALSRDHCDETLSDAVQTIFPIFTEEAFVAWGPEYIALNYKYEVSEILDDLVALLARVVASPTGRAVVHWPCSSFSGEWTVAWTEESVTVGAAFLAVRGTTPATISAMSPLVVPRDRFIAEWAGLLRIVHEALRHAGYGVDFTPLEPLTSLVTLLPAGGLLYASPVVRPPRLGASAGSRAGPLGQLLAAH